MLCRIYCSPPENSTLLAAPLAALLAALLAAPAVADWSKRQSYYPVSPLGRRAVITPRTRDEGGQCVCSPHSSWTSPAQKRSRQPLRPVNRRLINMNEELDFNVALCQDYITDPKHIPPFIAAGLQCWILNSSSGSENLRLFFFFFLLSSERDKAWKFVFILWLLFFFIPSKYQHNMTQIYLPPPLVEVFKCGCLFFTFIFIFCKMWE